MRIKDFKDNNEDKTEDFKGKEDDVNDEDDCKSSTDEESDDQVHLNTQINTKAHDNLTAVHQIPTVILVKS